MLQQNTNKQDILRLLNLEDMSYELRLRD